MFDETYINGIYNNFAINYKKLLSLITTDDEYNFYKPWLDFICCNIKYLSNTYKNRNQYIKRTYEDILAKELNKLVIVMSYMYKNYNSFNNFENINKFREFIIDSIEINFYEYDIVNYYSNKLITINKFPELFIQLYNKLISLLNLIYSFIYVNYEADKDVKNLIIHKHKEFIKLLIQINFRSSLSRCQRH